MTVPPGAVVAPVDFTVEEITSTAPGAVDPNKAYRIGPEGAVFATPVRLAFVAAAPGASLDGLSIAYQERQGFWLRYRDRDVVRDTTAGTLTVETLHFSDWSVVRRSARNLDGTVNVSSTLGFPFTASGTLTLDLAAEDTSGAYYLQWGTLTLDAPSVASGTVACTAAQPAFDLDASVAEVMTSPAFRFGLSGRWPLSCSDAGGPAYDDLLSLQFDTLGISHPSCTRTLAPGAVISQDHLQGQYTLDCGTDGGLVVSWDLTTSALRVPVAVADTATVAEGGSVVVDVLANDTVADGVAAVAVTGPPASGTAVVNADHTVTYTPAAWYFGSDAFTYQVTDVDGQAASATVSVTVTPVDSGPPVAVADAASTPEDVAVTVAVLGNDTVLDPPATVTLAIARRTERAP